MKRLLFCRHAKSSWKDYSLKDIDRPLNKRGQRDAPFIAQKLKTYLGSIDLLFTSPAKRAVLTRSYFINAIMHKNLALNESIYEASLDDLLNVICDLDDEYSTVMIFGHNPSLTSLYNHFSDDYIVNLPTCGIFGLSSVSLAWSDIDTTNTTVDFLIYPKMYIL